MGRTIAARTTLSALLARLRERAAAMVVKALTWIATSAPIAWIADWHASALLAVAFQKTDHAPVSLADVLLRRRDTDP